MNRSQISTEGSTAATADIPAPELDESVASNDSRSLVPRITPKVSLLKQIFSFPAMLGGLLVTVVFASVARIGGLRGLQALLIVLGAGIMLALYGYATLRSRNSKAGFVAATVLLILAAANFNLRPQMLGYLFLVLTLIALERFRQGRQTALWFLPALFLIWIHTHATWEIGLGTILVYWLCGLREFRAGDIEMHAWKPEERMRLS